MAYFFLWNGKGMCSTIMTVLSAPSLQQTKPTQKYKRLDGEICSNSLNFKYNFHQAYRHEETLSHSKIKNIFKQWHTPHLHKNHQTVMPSAGMAEMDALYTNTHKEIKICNILKEIGPPQPCMLVQTNNQLQRASSTAGCKQNIPKQWT